MPQDTATLQLPPLRDAVIGASRSILRYGLFPAVSCVLHQGPVQRDHVSSVVF